MIYDWTTTLRLLASTSIGSTPVVSFPVCQRRRCRLIIDTSNIGFDTDTRSPKIKDPSMGQRASVLSPK